MDFIEAAGRVLRSPAFKFVLILLLIIVLIIPLFLVYGLVSERESRAQGVRREVGQQPQRQLGRKHTPQLLGQLAFCGELTAKNVHQRFLHPLMFAGRGKVIQVVKKFDPSLAERTQRTELLHDSRSLNSHQQQVVPVVFQLVMGNNFSQTGKF